MATYGEIKTGIVLVHGLTIGKFFFISVASISNGGSKEKISVMLCRVLTNVNSLLCDPIIPLSSIFFSKNMKLSSKPTLTIYLTSILFHF